MCKCLHMGLIVKVGFLYSAAYLSMLIINWSITEYALKCFPRAACSNACLTGYEVPMSKALGQVSQRFVRTTNSIDPLHRINEFVEQNIVRTNFC